jgi:hypothetical protein
MLVLPLQGGIFFGLMATYQLVALLVGTGERHLVGSALALGMAIALKGYPVLALPYFVLTAPPRKRVLTAILACVPLAAAVLVYGAAFGFSPGMVTRLIHYRSTFDFGWKGLHSLRVTHFVLQRWVARALEMSLIGFAAVGPAVLFRRRPAAAMASIFLVFYATMPTMSVQYLLWVVPFLCLALPLGAVLYSFVALAGALRFYNLQPTAIPSFAPWPQLAARLWSVRTETVGAIIAVSAMLGVYLIVSRFRSQPLFPRTLAEARVSLQEYLGRKRVTGVPRDSVL